MVSNWLSRDVLFLTPICNDHMLGDGFLLLWRYLHFNENSVQSADRWFKIKSVVQHLREKFGSILVPCQNLCVDEGMMLWKGRWQFKQYIPTKRHRYDVKCCRLRWLPQWILSSIRDLKDNSSIRNSLVSQDQSWWDLCNPIFGRVTICSWTTGLRIQPFSRSCMRIRLGPVTQRGVIATTDTLIFYLLWDDSTIHEARLANTEKTHWQPNAPLASQYRLSTTSKTCVSWINQICRLVTLSVLGNGSNDTKHFSFICCI